MLSSPPIFACMLIELSSRKTMLPATSKSQYTVVELGNVSFAANPVFFFHNEWMTKLTENLKQQFPTWQSPC